MNKPWSITTTLRNPERLRDFLIVLKDIEGEDWNSETQKKFQILLIKNRIYGYGSNQFYSNLPKEQINLIDDLNKEITFEQAKKIFTLKNYEDPAMRGRQSFNPLKKLGLVSIQNKRIIITELGKLLLKDVYNLGEMFFRSFIKWQIPNPDNHEYKYEEGYDIKPFIGTLHLINIVNKKTSEAGNIPKGLSKQEFSLFVPTLINYEDIEKCAIEIINLRHKLKGEKKYDYKSIFENFEKLFAQKFLKTQNDIEVNKLLNNLKDYGDNIIRYFRLTRYFYIRGNGYYIDLEPRRRIEIENLLAFDNGKSITFNTKQEYQSYISNISVPKLPWESKEKYYEIILEVLKDIKRYEKELSIKEKIISDYSSYNENEFKNFLGILRDYRRQLQEKKNHIISQDIVAIVKYIYSLENIYKEEDRSIALEKYIALALYALNDILRIQPNYPVGDDNEPTFTAPAGKPDIECYYEYFNAICEVTMLTGRDQWYYEGQPIMRHLREFEIKNKDKVAFCIFIAPVLHRDTLNTFWFSIKYEYEGSPQKIIPLTIKNFIDILKTLVDLKQKGVFLSHVELFNLYSDILSYAEKVNNAINWVENIPKIIFNWQNKLTS